MRILLALIAALCCAGLGGAAAGALERRARSAREWEGALLRLESAVTHMSLPLPEILECGAGEDVPLLLLWAQSLREDPAGSLKELAGLAEKPREFSAREWSTIRDCMESLGAESRDEQRAGVRRARELFADTASRAKEDREKKYRLYLSLGCLSGAALFILLC